MGGVGVTVMGGDAIDRGGEETTVLVGSFVTGAGDWAQEVSASSAKISTQREVCHVPMRGVGMVYLFFLTG